MPEASQKLLGTISWADQAHVDAAGVDRAILRPNGELVIDLVYEGSRYTVTLKKIANNEFRGRYVTQWQGRPAEGVVTCRLFTAGRQVLLLGRWEEDQQRYYWWAELNATEHFSDESSN